MNRTIKVLNTVMYAALLAQPLLQLTSCAEQTDISRTAGAGAEPIVIHFDTQGFTDNTTSGNTRANNGAGHGEAGTTVAAGDQFTVWFKSGSTVQSAVYTVQSDLTTAKVVPTADNPQPYFLDGATTAEVGGAYYPAMKPMAPARFSVQSDQCTEGTNAVSQEVTGDARYRASDLMFAAGGISNSPKPATGATLTFQHRMAMLTVKMTTDETDNALDCPIQECYIVGGACRTVRLADPTTLTPGYETDSLVTEAAPLKLWYTNSTTYKNTSYGWHASCLLPPQRIGRQTTAGTPERFLRIKHATGEYTYFRIHPVTLLSGRHYTIYLTLRPWMKGRTLTLSSWDGTGTCTLTAVDQTYGDAATGLYSVGGVTFKMKKVSGGSYTTLGGTTAYGTLSDYWMAETETTQALWHAVMGSVPGSQWVTGDAYPVGNITAEQITGADGFLARLNAATTSQRPAGFVFAVPSDAQWEWAARGGVHTHGYTYSGSSTPNDVAWHGGTTNGANNDGDGSENAGGVTHPVAQLRANELGLYDMSGNLREMSSGNSYAAGQNLGLDYNYPANSYYVRNGSSDNSFNWQTVTYRNGAWGTSNHHTLRLALVGPQSFGYKGAVQPYVIPATGYYKIECWGASGGNSGSNLGGRGGYAAVYRQLTAGTTVYVYVGECGDGHTTTGTWNGGGRPAIYNGAAGGGGGMAGGGASDVRTVNAAWNDATGLQTRLIVAGGGGGATEWTYTAGGGQGGYGGGETGGNGNKSTNSTGRDALYSVAYGGGQSLTGNYSEGGKHITSGESNEGGGHGYNGQLGIGGNGADETTRWGNSTYAWGSGGGGGYYGGGGAAWTHNSIGTGGGGSGYVDDSGNAANGRQNIAGNASMPAPGGGTETGHTGHGYVRITWYGTTAP